MRRIFTTIAAVALTLGVAASAHPDDNGNYFELHNHDIEVDEVKERALVCVGYLSGQIDADDVRLVYSLDDWQKFREWRMGCYMFKIGLDVGKEMSVDSGSYI